MLIAQSVIKVWLFEYYYININTVTNFQPI